MNKINIDYALDIFRALTTELPDELLYRDNGDSIELRSPDSMMDSLAADILGNGWNMIGSQMIEAA